MKRNPSTGVRILGVLFLSVGFIWCSAILGRSSKIMERGGASSASVPVKAFQIGLMKEEMTKTIERFENPGHPYLTKLHVTSLWRIVSLELLSSLMYIASGVALLRLYPYARTLVFSTLVMDASLKMLVIHYMHYWAVPLQQFSKTANLMITYYAPGREPFSIISLYLSGLRVYLPGGKIYFYCYLLYLLVCLSFIIQPQVKKQFLKEA